YDQGIATSGDMTETTHLFSDDGGATWSRPTPLSERPFHAGYGNDTGQPNIGDYNQAVAQSSELFAVWAGTPEFINFADGQPTTSFTEPDVIFKRLTDATKPLAVRLGAVSVDGTANGFIDAGETIQLRPALENYVTNAISKGSVSGIQATLTSPTPGVTVLS